MNAILGGTGFTYEIKDRYIKIVPKPRDNRPRSRTITGRVLDERQEPLIGASITVEGTDVGAITDIDGRFSIEASTGNVLRFTYLGYQPASVKVTEKAVYNIQLTGDVDVLSEVVVTLWASDASRKPRATTSSRSSPSSFSPSRTPTSSTASAVRWPVSRSTAAPPESEEPARW